MKTRGTLRRPRAADLGAPLRVILLVLPVAGLAYLLARISARGTAEGTRPAARPPPAHIPVAAFTEHLSSGIRPIAGWRQASLRQRFVVTVSALCAASLVAGVVLAVTGVGKPRSLLPGPGLAPRAAAVDNRARAAAWIAQQVSPAVSVSCDPAMCGQVQEKGFPGARLMALRPTSGNPLRSGVVVATPEIRNQFGPRLAAVYAPLVIAAFGSGATRVDVRSVAPGGAAAFHTQLAAEHAFLISAGKQLLHNRNIQVSQATQASLMAGQVDSRLLAILAVLASDMPIRLVAFGDLPPGAGPAASRRGAEIGAASPAALAAILAFLHAQHAPYLPAVAAMTRSANGRPLVTVRYDAVGLMNVGGS